MVMEGEKGAVRTTDINAHLKDLMVDTELCRWEKVCVYHVVWLNQLEQGWVSWDDQEEKLRSLHALVWHTDTSTTLAVPNLPKPSQKQDPREGYSYNVPVKPGSKWCQAFNQGLCSDGSAHGKDLNICSYS